MLLFQRINTKPISFKNQKTSDGLDRYYLMEELEGLDTILNILAQIGEWGHGIPDLEMLSEHFNITYNAVREAINALRRVQLLGGKNEGRRNIMRGKLLLNYYVEFLTQTFKQYPNIAKILNDFFTDLNQTGNYDEVFLNAQSFLIKVTK
jgi:hypothetical protein